MAFLEAFIEQIDTPIRNLLQIWSKMAYAHTSFKDLDSSVKFPLCRANFFSYTDSEFKIHLHIGG